MAWASNLLDLPHALLEQISTELTLPGASRYARVCSLLRELIKEHGALWLAHLQARGVTSQQPRLALRDLTTLEAARWTDFTARLPEESPGTLADVIAFNDGQPNPQKAHAAFTCNDGKTLVVVGVLRSAAFLSAWVIDLSGPSTRWQEAVQPRPEYMRILDGTRPAARRFTADGGGGGVLRDRAGREWLCLFGGLIVDSSGRPRYRDNETWLLGPLSSAAGCAQWEWWQVQDDGEAQSEDRPTPRFHHSQTVLWGGVDACGTLAVCGGNDYTMSPLLELASLSLRGVDLAPPTEGEPGPPPSLPEVEWLLEPDGETEEQDGAPQPRSRHAAAGWDGHGLFLCGGEGVVKDVDGEDDQTDDDVTAEVWLMQTGSQPPQLPDRLWLRLPDLPHARTRAAAAVVKGEHLVVCGGLGYGDPKAVWVLPLLPQVDGLPDSWCGGLHWAELSLRRGLESPRLDAMLCVAHGDIIVLGGGHTGEELDDFADAKGGFYAEGETAAWRLRRGGGEGEEEEKGVSVARCRTCGAGLLLDPIKAADPKISLHASGQITRLRLFQELGEAVRLVDSGVVGSVSDPPRASPFGALVRVHDVNESVDHLDKMPLLNVRPRLLPEWHAGGHLTLAVCATGVVAVRGWRYNNNELRPSGGDMMELGEFLDSQHKASGMAARGLSFVP